MTEFIDRIVDSIDKHTLLTEIIDEFIDRHDSTDTQKSMDGYIKFIDRHKLLTKINRRTKSIHIQNLSIDRNYVHTENHVHT